MWLHSRGPVWCFLCSCDNLTSKIRVGFYFSKLCRKLCPNYSQGYIIAYYQCWSRHFCAVKASLGRNLLAVVSRTIGKLPNGGTELGPASSGVPLAARSKAYVCSRSPAEIVGSNPARGMDVFLLLSVVYCQAEVSATGRSLVQRSPTDCGASLCVI